MRIQLVTLLDSSREWSVILLPTVAFEREEKRKKLTIAWLFWGLTFSNL